MIKKERVIKDEDPEKHAERVWEFYSGGGSEKRKGEWKSERGWLHQIKTWFWMETAQEPHIRKKIEVEKREMQATKQTVYRQDGAHRFQKGIFTAMP